MIERLYIDNFRSFQNFEWKPGPVALLLGRNGVGKTALFDVLHIVRALVCAEAPLGRSSRRRRVRAGIYGMSSGSSSMCRAPPACSSTD